MAGGTANLTLTNGVVQRWTQNRYGEYVVSAVTALTNPTMLNYYDTIFYTISYPQEISKKAIKLLRYSFYGKSGEAFTDNAIIANLKEPLQLSKIEDGTYKLYSSSTAGNYFEARTYVVAIRNSGQQVGHFNGTINATREQVDKIKNGFALCADLNYTNGLTIYTASSTQYPLELAVDYEDITPRPKNAMPSSGFVNNHDDIIFRWEIDCGEVPAFVMPTQASAVFRWKNGAAGTVTEINLTTEQSVTLAAETLPQSNEIMWQVQITTDDGITDPNPEWYTLTTIDSVPVVTGVSPKSGYVQGDGEVTFAWNYAIATGSEQTAYEVQYMGAGDADWITLASGSGSLNSVIVQASSLPSGTVQWRARAANTDEVYSSYSDLLTFVVIAAPPAPTINVSNDSPMPTITWQSATQEAFQIQIGSFDSGVIFGTQKEFTSPIILENGQVKIRVRVVNDLNLWSAWGESGITIANDPGQEAQEVMLRGNEGIDAQLFWQTENEVIEYRVYRNGEEIAKTQDTQFTDMLHLGIGKYFVRAVLQSGNYVQSNLVQITAKTDRAMIAEIGKGEWIDIGLSAVMTPTVDQNFTATVSLMQLSGAVYPIPEIGPSRQRAYTLEISTTEAQIADAVKMMLAKLVCVKNQYGDCVVGIISSISSSRNTFITTLRATLMEVDPSAYAGDQL